MSLPTYQAATRKPTKKDALELVSRFITSGNDLASCCRVSKEWYDIFSSILWADPLSKITSEVNLLRFFNGIGRTPSTKKMQLLDTRGCVTIVGSAFASMSLNIDAVHELSIRRREGSTAGGEEGDQSTAPKPKKFKTLVRRLITSAILGGVRFLVLDSHGDPDDNDFNVDDMYGMQPAVLSLDGLRILLDEPLAAGRAYLPPVFDDVQYLNLSNSQWYSSTLSRAPLAIFGMFTGIQVLKLRNCGITYQDVKELHARQAKLGRLSSLDLRDNNLSDECFNIMGLFRGVYREYCYEAFPYQSHTLFEVAPDYEAVAINREHHSRWQVDRNARTIPDDVDEFIAWVKPIESFETATYTGLRQLYLSGNNFSFGSLFALMRRTAFHTFACDASPARCTTAEFWRDSLPRTFQESTIPTFVALSSYQHAPKLERLAIHHSFVTYRSARKDPKEQAIPVLGETFGVVKSPNQMWGFLPEVNNNLQYLELNGIPKFGRPELLADLEHFLRKAAESEYELKPYRSVKPWSSEEPRPLPGLKKLTLVFTDKPEEEPTSVTGDEDAERFMMESENDFSFFEEEKGRGKKSAMGKEVERNQTPLVDIIAGIAAYRTKTRVAYNTLAKVVGENEMAKRTSVDPHYHWSGVVEIHR